MRTSAVNGIKKWKMLLIDFDGVISRNSVSVLLDAYHQAINEFIPTPIEVSKIQMKNTICLPAEKLQQAIELSLESLGLTSKKQEYFSIFQQMIEQRLPQILIDPEFYEFAQWCKENSLEWRIFSLADRRLPHVRSVIDSFGEEILFPICGRSKESHLTYNEVCKELNVDKENCMVVDDACQALRAAKTCSLTTVMMTNEVFTNDDYHIWGDFIDYKIGSFGSLKEIVAQ